MKNLMFTTLAMCLALFASAQTDEQKAAQEKARMDQLSSSTNLEEKEGWTRTAAIGLDLGQLLNINPYLGAGNSRLGLGGAFQYKAALKKGLTSWKNDILFNFSAEKTGSGLVSAGSDEKVPFRKALDMLQLNSNLAFKTSKASAWSYAFDFGLRSQLFNSYVDSATQLIYMKELNEGNYNTKLVSKLFSPALITFAPGIQYSKSKDWQIFISPAAGQLLFISDQKIANLGVHGTPLKEGSTTEYETSKFALGAFVKAGYTHKYFDKLNVASELSLFSDYLDQPQHIDVVWMNNIGIELFKGFHLNLKADLYYDHDKINNISDGNAVGGIQGTGRRINVIEQLLVTYTRRI
ncbi:MAG: DUF3078 domain-containing protein [Saprospiraceae bacterium]|nr:DUF3078 domain-containing protein [Saprospiraceae bacterium]